MLSLAVHIIITNGLESLWMRGFEMLWIVFLILAAEVGRYWKPRRRPARTRRERQRTRHGLADTRFPPPIAPSRGRRAMSGSASRDTHAVNATLALRRTASTQHVNRGASRHGARAGFPANDPSPKACRKAELDSRYALINECGNAAD